MQHAWIWGDNVGIITKQFPLYLWNEKGRQPFERPQRTWCSQITNLLYMSGLRTNAQKTMKPTHSSAFSPFELDTSPNNFISTIFKTGGSRMLQSPVRVFGIDETLLHRTIYTDISRIWNTINMDPHLWDGLFSSDPDHNSLSTKIGNIWVTPELKSDWATAAEVLGTNKHGDYQIHDTLLPAYINR